MSHVLSVLAWIGAGILSLTGLVAWLVLSVWLTTRPFLRPLTRREMKEGVRASFETTLLYLRAFSLDRQLAPLERIVYGAVQHYSRTYVHKISVIKLGRDDGADIPGLDTSDSDWKTRFSELASRSRIVILAPLIPPHEAAEGLMYEISVILVHHKDKLVLAMPPNADVLLRDVNDVESLWTTPIEPIDASWPKYRRQGAFLRYDRGYRGPTWQLHPFSAASLARRLESILYHERHEYRRNQNKIIQRIWGQRKVGPDVDLDL